MKTNLTTFLIKFSILVLIFAMLPLQCSIPTSIFVTWVYQYIIALIFGLKTMPAMDLMCFVGDEKSNANFTQITTFEKYPFEKMKARVLNRIKDKWKLRCKVREILGDFYYEVMKPEDAIDYVFQKIPKDCKDIKELEALIGEDLNKPMPLNTPQYRIWWQESYQDKYSLFIFKEHHSVGDGISGANFLLSLSDEFDTKALMPIRHATLALQIFLRLSFFLHIPGIFCKTICTKNDRNILHDGKRQLSGKKILATSGLISFKNVKEAAHRNKMTINDFLTAGVGAGIKQYMHLKGDAKTSKIHMVIPANIRFGPYSSWEEVKMENKFAPVSLYIPLEPTMKNSLYRLKRVSDQHKTQFVDIYAMYATTFYLSQFAPHFLLNKILDLSSKPYTLAFSNVPGYSKHLSLEGKKSSDIQCYVIPTGRAGMCVCIVSYVDHFKMTITTDDAVMSDPQVLLDLIEKNIREAAEAFVPQQQDEKEKVFTKIKQ